MSHSASKAAEDDLPKADDCRALALLGSDPRLDSAGLLDWLKERHFRLTERHPAD